MKLLSVLCAIALAAHGADVWPDGSEMSVWFLDGGIQAPDAKTVRLIDNGIYPNEGVVRTREIQSLIDRTAAEGGGVITVTPGIFKTGALFFKPGVHLKLDAGAVLLGSDDIADYPLVETRIEGQTCRYFPAIVNADCCDGFTILGPGAIDGNGFRAWRSFWIRRKWNKCTNKDEQRARVLFVSNSRNVQISGACFQNSMFWTTHFHKCDFLKIVGCRFYALAAPNDVKGPSTDGIDLDVCSDVLVKDCWISNNDDGVCLKGGKGAFADDFARFPGNGENHRILIEGLVAKAGCHTALTLGSESVRCDNVVFRNSTVDGASNLLHLKMRTDTPQLYTNILVDNVNGRVRNAFLQCKPWSQFADLEGRAPADVLSRADKVCMRNCKVDCKTFLALPAKDGTAAKLGSFRFENLAITARDISRHEDVFEKVEFTGVTAENVK